MYFLIIYAIAIVTVPIMVSTNIAVENIIRYGAGINSAKTIIAILLTQKSDNLCKWFEVKLIRFLLRPNPTDTGIK